MKELRITDLLFIARFHKHVWLPVILCGIATCLGFVSLARADNSNGTLIVTLNKPIINGVSTDAYRTYFIRGERTDGKAGFQLRYEEGWAAKSPDDLGASGGNGAVVMKELSAGDYNVTLYQIEGHGPYLRWRPAQEFRIPFKIQPGRATYIGSFQPAGHMGDGVFLGTGVRGARMIVADQHVRDIPIAQAKDPKLGPVDVSVFNVDTLNNPLLNSHDVTTEPNEDLWCRYVNLLGCIKPSDSATK